MALKFRHKVFLAFLLNSMLTVLCMLWIGRTIAHRSFEAYIHKVEMQRIDALVEALSQEFEKSGDWAPVVKAWSHWLERMGPGQPPQGIGMGAMLPPFPGGGPRPGELPPLAGPHPLPPRPDPLRLFLFDADRRPLTSAPGAPEEIPQMKPIRANDRLVGWLGVAEPDPPMHPLDLEFLKQQSQAFSVTAGVALVLALLVTLVLSRHLLAPVRELAEGTRALSSRRFETRIAVRAQDEFGQLAADFNAMAQALERFERMRRQWMADISHELRTPLAVLRAEIEAMQDGVREVSPEALDSLHGEVQHVSRIVHDLHDLSLIESDAFDGERSAVDPVEILEETLRAFMPRLSARGIEAVRGESGASPALVLADAGRLKQLFSNILENTLRYAQAPGELTVSHALTADEVAIQLEDSGPGVPEASLERLFDRLYRVDEARSRAEGGSGLGLAICKGIVERFGGRIEGSTGAAGGLRITVVFPVANMGERG